MAEKKPNKPPKAKGRRKATRPPGRPPADVDPDKVYELAKIHCTMPEMVAILGIGEDTLRRRFAGVIEKGRSEGKSSLRRTQWKAAEAGNTTMLIWLGKQLLDQTDKSIHEHSGHIDLAKLSDDELAALAAIVEKAHGSEKR